MAQNFRDRVKQWRETLPIREERLRAAGKAVTAIVNSEGRIVAGTDATAERLPNGLSFHTELECLVYGGLSPLQALQAVPSLPLAWH